MPKAGTVSVLIDSPMAASAAQWLKRRKQPEPTLLGRSASNREHSEELLAAFRTQLEKAGRRKNAKRSLRVDQETAHEFVLASVPFWPSWGMNQPKAVRDLRKNLVEKLDRRKRIGRPKLDSRSLERRLGASYAYDERNRRRLKPRLARAKRNELQKETFERWFAEVQRRGETILTTTLPIPETP
ncbi:MAG: hypothetical protein ABJF09_12430 [Qipengyuania citrea]|uniref:hypothetical protein n=1 Tax=Alphaproteobacteria TaxID=28211 RepID=UPI001E46E927|nr:hypothetical protein [Qipengyuania citrea]MCD1591231.1 hypothetical protein [Qipengyuania citrea]